MHFSLSTHIHTHTGWDHMQTIDSLLKKGGYRGVITPEVRHSIKLTRYQSEFMMLSYSDYVSHLNNKHMNGHASYNGTHNGHHHGSNHHSSHNHSNGHFFNHFTNHLHHKSNGHLMNIIPMSSSPPKHISNHHLHDKRNSSSSSSSASFSFFNHFDRK